MILLMQQYIKVHQKSAIELKKRGVMGMNLMICMGVTEIKKVDIHRGGTNKDELLLDYLDKGIDTNHDDTGEEPIIQLALSVIGKDIDC